MIELCWILECRFPEWDLSDVSCIRRILWEGLSKNRFKLIFDISNVPASVRFLGDTRDKIDSQVIQKRHRKINSSVRIVIESVWELIDSVGA